MSSAVFQPQTERTVLMERAVSAAPSAGLATAGYRSAKYSPADWLSNNTAAVQRALADRLQAEEVRRASQAVSGALEARVLSEQSRVTQLLGSRLQDVHLRRAELESGAQKLSSRTDLLLERKRRLEKALLTTDIPLNISTDNLKCRERRFGPDLVHDQVEEQLLKEVELIRNVQALLKKTLEQTVNQIRINREVKQTLELDWSDKHEAYRLDEQCGRYSNRSTDTQHHPGSATLHHQLCDEEAWLRCTQVNVCEADRQCVCSDALAQLCDQLLQETLEDLLSHNSAVQESFTQRCQELSQARSQLETQLSQVLEQIGAQERNIASLQQTIYDKEAPLRVAQSRLYYRSQRPNMELCRDQPHVSLLGEVEQISSCLTALQQQLSEARGSLALLEDTRMILEKDISCKTHSLHIDHKCLTNRTHYPTSLALSGY